MIRQITRFMRITAFALAGFLGFMGGQVSAETTVVGNDAIPRTLQTGDIARFPFLMIFAKDTFPCGTIEKWETHVINILGGGEYGTMGLLALTPESDSYRISGVDIRRNVTIGLNTFEEIAIDVGEGDVLGLYIETARVSLDFSTNDPKGPILYDLNTRWPRVGRFVSDLDGASIRTYSLNATVTTDCPEPIS